MRSWILPFVLSSGFILSQAYCVFFRVEKWPFSNYPMFAYRTTVEQTKLIRLAFEDEKGNRSWWVPSNLYFDTKYFDLGFSRILERAGKQGTEQGTEDAQKIAYLKSIYHSIQLDQPDLKPRKLVVVERSITDGLSGPSVSDQDIDSVDVERLR